MLSAVVRRLRDPDSSVRSACVDAVASMSAAAPSRSSFSSVFLRPLLESLLIEQDPNAQMASAMCLAAAIDPAAGADLTPHLQRLLPRLVKLARSNAFKAKPALLSLLGTVVSAGGASSPAALELLIPCLVEMLSSEDWATRKASAEALSSVASLSDTHLLVTFKSCISSCEARRFDKVKIVRDTMNQMLQAWKDLPDSLSDKGERTNDAEARSRSPPMNDSDPSSSPIRESGTSGPRFDSHSLTRNIGQLSGRSPPQVLPASDEKRRRSPPLFRKLDRTRKPAGWGLEVAVPKRHSEDINLVGQKDVKVTLFGDDSEAKTNGIADSEAGAHELSHQERGSLVGDSLDEIHENCKENSEMFLIREQLAQIENQQSNLMGLLQSFIGGAQSSVHSLETRVHNLELALAELSHEMALSLGRMSNACWRLPGADFLSCKFWRTERRPPFGNRSGLVVNPLAETNFHGRTSLDTIQDGRHFGMASASARSPSIRNLN